MYIFSIKEITYVCTEARTSLNSLIKKDTHFFEFFSIILLIFQVTNEENFHHTHLRSLIEGCIKYPLLFESMTHYNFLYVLEPTCFLKLKEIFQPTRSLEPPILLETQSASNFHVINKKAFVFSHFFCSNNLLGSSEQDTLAGQLTQLIVKILS